MNSQARRSHNAALASAGNSIIQVHSGLKPVSGNDDGADSRALYKPPQDVHPLNKAPGFRPSSAKLHGKKGQQNSMKGSDRVSNLKGPLQGSLSAATLAPKPAFVLGPSGSPIVRPPSPDNRQVVYTGPITKPADPKQPLRRPAKEAFLEVYTGMKRPGAGGQSKTPSGKTSTCCPRCGYPYSAPPPSAAGSGAPVPFLSSSTHLMNKKNGFRGAPQGAAGGALHARSKSPLLTGKEGVVGNFRSEVLNLEVELQERMQGLEETYPNLDSPNARLHKLEIFSDIFEAIIGKSKLYGNLLGIIKQEYDYESGRLASSHRSQNGSQPGSPDMGKIKSAGDWAIRPRLQDGLRQNSQRVSSSVGSSEAELEQDQEIERLRGENTRLQEETTTSSKKMEEIERAVGLEREAMRHERTAMQQDYMELQSCLNEREQDIQQLGQIITALQRGDIKIEHLRQLDLSGGLYSERGNSQGQEPPSKFADVPVEDVTWEISLSSRGAVPRPKSVPFLNLANIHPPPNPQDAPPPVSNHDLTPSEHSYAGDSPPPSDVKEPPPRPESRAGNHEGGKINSGKK